MPVRLSPLDVAFLHVEGTTTPMHLGELAIFDPGDSGFDYERLVLLIERRIGLVPRYRQKVRWVPGNLASPVWVDDSDFDLTYHVRRSALPRPGSDKQLLDFCARILSRPLDRSRPLWEMYLIEGLDGGRLALATKTHQSMVDGNAALDLGQVILDRTPRAQPVTDVLWMPEPAPSDVDLVVSAVGEALRRPTALLDAGRLAAADVRSTARMVTHAASSVLTTLAAAIRPAPASPLNRTVGEQRRIAIARTELADYRQVRASYDATVNDVALATIAGALRGWLLSRGSGVASGSTIRVLLPVSVQPETEPMEPDPAVRPPNVAAAQPVAAVQPPGVASAVNPLLVELPVGEANPLLRLAQVGYATKAHRESGRSVRAETLMAVSGFAPPTLHALGARAANGLARRAFNLVVTNVPGPQVPLYLDGARLVEVYPVLPLSAGQSLTIALTSYDGGVYYGLNADRDAMPDLEVLADLIEESLAELVEATAVTDPPARRAATLTRLAHAGSRRRIPPGR